MFVHRREMLFVVKEEKAIESGGRVLSALVKEFIDCVPQLTC